MSFKRKWSFRTKVQLESHHNDVVECNVDSKQNEEVNVVNLSATLQNTEKPDSDEIVLSCGKLDVDTVSQVENTDNLEKESIDFNVDDASCLAVDTSVARELFLQSDHDE
ncbi:jg968 [Pararge aegeria aegeria]|uniref:Jg968 protein n=1 Tax=Pararge aegeria aegeria TaxID=348720 RepID=A0A8S4S9T1_9NEOP|nr:jg968 [Pararge aegeria aegeria]